MVIRIAGYPVYMRLGCYPEERLAGQEVLVSLNLEGGEGLSPAPTPALASPSVDYSHVLTYIDNLLEGKEVALIETAVAMVGHGLLACFPMLQAVEVSILKPRLPGNVNKGAEISVSQRYEQGDSPVGAGRS